MREILFRGKRIDNGEWVFGMPWIFKDHACICPWKKGMCKYDTGYFPILVESKTVGQYTGLTDQNGDKIFDGDIIKNHDFNAEDGGYGVVEYDDGAFEINGNGISATFHENYWGKECEVVGNIYDNPELLGGVDGETD